MKGSVCNWPSNYCSLCQAVYSIIGLLAVRPVSFSSHQATQSTESTRQTVDTTPQMCLFGVYPQNSQLDRENSSYNLSNFKVPYV